MYNVPHEQGIQYTLSDDFGLKLSGDAICHMTTIGEKCYRVLIDLDVIIWNGDVVLCFESR